MAANTNFQNLPIGGEEAARVRRMPMAQYMAQLANAADIEARIYAKMVDMEKRGIVKHVYQDEWQVLDQKRYTEEMGMPGPENTNANR